MSKSGLRGVVEMHIYMGGGGASEKCATIGCTVKMDRAIISVTLR